MSKILKNGIKMIVLDVDGTMTDGKLTFVNLGGQILESKSFNVKDGMGIAMWVKSNRLVSIISARKCEIVEKRAAELGIQEVHLGVKDKLECLRQICERRGLEPSEVACIGDDVNDIPMFEFCKYSFAPCDASRENLARATFITRSRGGEGAVREMVEWIEKMQDLGQK